MYSNFCNFCSFVNYLLSQTAEGLYTSLSGGHPVLFVFVFTVYNLKPTFYFNLFDFFNQRQPTRVQDSFLGIDFNNSCIVMMMNDLIIKNK